MARLVRQMLQHPDGPVVGRQRLVRAGLSKVSWEALDESTAPLFLQQETRSPERAINTGMLRMCAPPPAPSAGITRVS